MPAVPGNVKVMCTLVFLSDDGSRPITHTEAAPPEQIAAALAESVAAIVRRHYRGTQLTVLDAIMDDGLGGSISHRWIPELEDDDE